MNRRHLISTTIVALALAMTAHEASAGLLVGSEYTLVGTNFPDDFSQTVTLAPGMTTIDSGQLTLTQTIYNVRAGVQWLDLYFQTVGGGPLANDFGALWEVQANGLQVSPPVFVTGFFIYWTANGAAFDPINQAPGFNLPVEPNPIDPSLGPVFGNTYQGLGPYSTVGEYAYANPYSGISDEGVDPNTANGFHMALLVNSVPEPSSLSLAAIAAIALGWVVARAPGNCRRTIS